MRKIKDLFFHVFSIIDQYLKFPSLKRGETGIQIGFDMTSPITSDLFEMSRKVGKGGSVFGIDPDPWNHTVANDIISNRGISNLNLLIAGTYSKKTKANFLFGERASWNQTDNIPIDETVKFSGEEVEVQLETLDDLLDQNGIDIKQVGHVNITNNGAEYHTLLGFERSLLKADDIALTIVAGRYDASGTIDGKPDYVVIQEYLNSLGFRTTFKRIHQLFWWGFCVRLLINRTWIYNKKNYGIVFAAKGNIKIPFYQSFS